MLRYAYAVYFIVITAGDKGIANSKLYKSTGLCYNTLMNTKNKGQVRLLIIETPKEYVGVCYEFAIVLENKNEDKLIEDLIEAAKGYIRTIRENNLPDSLLDKSMMLPEEYKSLFDELENRIAAKKSSRKLSDEYEEAIQTGRAHLAMACV